LIESVEVSIDGGQSWQEAQLQRSHAHPVALTRFRMPWQWEGQEMTLRSRCIDDTGYLQPSREALIEARGLNTRYHYNGITAWKVSSDGSVQNAYA